MTKDEMVEWHHRFDGPEFEQATRVRDGHVILCSEITSDFQSLGPHQTTKASVRDLTLGYFSNFVSF